MKNILKYLFMAITAAIVIAALIFGFNYLKNNSAGDVNEFGVIDLNLLIRNHPDYEKLATLEDKIAALKEQLSQSSDSLSGVGDKMRKIQSGAEKNLMEEVKKIQAKMQEERENLAKKMTIDQKNLAKEIKKLKTAEPEMKLTSPKKVSSKTVKQGLDNFSKDLMLLKEKQVAAKRLELQNKLSEELKNLKEKNEEELSAHEGEILKQNQSQKIDLRLKYENAESAKVREEVMTKMKELDEKDTHLKDVKQMQLFKKFEEVKNKKLMEIEKEVASYDNKLQKDVLAQLGGKSVYEKNSKGELLAPQDGAVKEKINKQSEIYKKQMEDINKKYAKQFEAKKKELERNLNLQEKNLIAKALKKENNLDSASKSHIEEMNRQIKEVEDQRDRLYEEILGDIRAKVQELAKKEKIRYVIGGYIYNADCIDLTDKIK